MDTENYEQLEIGKDISVVGFNDQDKISLDISWKQTLSQLGGYIYLARLIKPIPTII